MAIPFEARPLAGLSFGAGRPHFIHQMPRTANWFRDGENFSKRREQRKLHAVGVNRVYGETVVIFQLSVLLVMILVAGAAGGLTIFALDRQVSPQRVRR